MRLIQISSDSYVDAFSVMYVETTYDGAVNIGFTSGEFIVSDWTAADIVKAIQSGYDKAMSALRVGYDSVDDTRD